ncbi:MAG: phenylalanine--tRNA ligase subunit alpha [Deltaproteobacteria bacterium]|jgi:phenylalanyl-tRNA synthetase alpha chain|nr:phenylalanine--tRNA ligase subunit alpha [Deltaproteobacteria bacterium]MBW2533646.1 phenylalanine--tRNA ligase subunit alpha [Deltaproteobacteria bacterium]
MPSSIELTDAARSVWEALEDGPRDVAAIVQATGLDQSQVMLAATEGADGGHIQIEERARVEVDPAADALDRLSVGLPERRAAKLLSEAGGQLPLPEFVEQAKTADIAVNEVFRWGGTRGWVERVKGQGPPTVVLTDAGRAALDGEAPDERSLELAAEGCRFLDEQAERGVDVDAVQKLLGKRADLAKLRSRTQRILSLTAAGRQALAQVEVKREQNVLSPEDLRSGAYQQITLRPYDVSLPAETRYPAKLHPLRRIMEQARRAFLELGFVEVVSPMVEAAFWNFDALFQPQDHPARDMQDTFYMAEPSTAPLPEATVVDRVSSTHENGGTTGSTGWGYRWSADEARRLVLRTHTTAATIRALASHPEPPYKAFCIGWTYRNETISYKHLPVFHQLDGIIIDEQANLTSLLGTLSAFYAKMGFSKVRFKPAFYPYTEPSVDVMVYMESRDKWIEMGGSGIFRPEVTEPLGCSHPVLAWGLGIERLAMLRLGFTDIRQLFQGGLDLVEEVPLCR